MPRTAPSVTAAPQRLQISVFLVDASGDKRSVTLNTTNVSVTDAQINAYVDALAAITQANAYGVSVERLYVTSASRSDALVGQRNSVYDNIVTLFKNPAQINGAVNGFIPAPVPALLVGNTDTPNPSGAGYDTYTDAVEVILGSGWDDESMRYTERREKNERVIT